jgi:hypothetical protein
MDGLLTPNAIPTPPATITSLDRTVAQDEDPWWIRGDRLDLRGCTYRSPAAVTNVANVSSSVVAFALVAGLTLTITPVSAQSILMFYVQGMLEIEGGNTDAIRAQVRVRNTTGGSNLSPILIRRRSPDGPTDESVSWATLVTQPLSGISAATTFEVQIAVADAAATMRLRGDLEPTRFWVVEHV